MKPMLSIIVPAYNEEKRLPKCLEALSIFCRTQPFPIDVLIVENGSTDNTYEIADDFSKQNSNFRVIREQQRGKGLAVKRGMLETDSLYRLFTDVDLSVPIEEAIKFLPPDCNSDIAIASREAPGSHRYGEPWNRHLMGRVFNLLVNLLILPGIKDTQCGFKCFQGNVADDIFPYLNLNGWSFDVEILYLARLRGYTINEIPVTWYYQENSKVNPLTDSVRMFTDILMIKKIDKYKLLNKKNNHNMYIN